MKLRIAAKPVEIEDVPDNYSQSLSAHVNDADKWFDEIGLRNTAIKAAFLERCTGPKNIAEPGNSGEILNDEIAIRLFILWLFSVSGGPINFATLADLGSDKPRSLMEQKMPGSPQFSSKIDELYLEEMKSTNDPKGFFNRLYVHLVENIDSWTNAIKPTITSTDISKIKDITNECFNQMLEEVKEETVDQLYVDNCKKNYLIHLNEIVDYLKKFLNELNVTEEKEEQGSGGKKKQEKVKLDLKQSSVTWVQTKSLMSDPRGQIRKIVAYSKFKQFQLSFQPFNRTVLKRILLKEEKVSISNKNILNYIYTNQESRYNTSSKDSLFTAKWATLCENLKFENLNNTYMRDELSKIMDWIKANSRTGQISYRVLNGQPLTEEDRTLETLPDGRTRLVFPEGSEIETYIDGQPIVYDGFPMGLMMFNMQKHRQGTPSSGLRSYNKPSQYDVENTVKNYSWSKMIEGQQTFHLFLQKFKLSETNYEEKHGIVKDYRNGAKYGFYWAILNSTSHSEEKARMSHCGGDSYGDLLSLRSMDPDESKKNIKELRNMAFWTGNSWLTAAVNKNGYIRQLKAINNSRPSELRDFEKIVDLISSELNTNVPSRVLPFSIENSKNSSKKLFNGETVDLSIYSKQNMIQPFPSSTRNPGFGDNGYEHTRDFHIIDLPDNLLKKLYEARPDFFDWNYQNEATNEIDERLKTIYRVEKERLRAEKDAEKERLKTEKEAEKLIKMEENTGN